MRSAKSTSHSFTTDLSTYLELSFIPNVKPTKEEYTIKETQRLFLQQLADTVSKGAKLLPFGYGDTPLFTTPSNDRTGTILESPMAIGADCILNYRSMANGFALKNSGQSSFNRSQSSYT